MSVTAWLRRRRTCKACGRPSRPGDRLVRRQGYRVHRSHTRDRSTGFYEGRHR